jgi:class 3 adenylate cyclase/tetratricopeptide (TPR) repeat protein
VPACSTCGLETEGNLRFCPRCGAELPPSTATREHRKTVTVVFSDITGSTALGETLDPERLRAVLARYFERMKAIVEHHGGTVEKFIGDAVMAVFGVPSAHEDDALRAIRAAQEMREAMPELGVQARIGVNTGEVVAGTEERLATGDAVNVAARLEQAASPGEVLLGATTLSLVSRAADVEPVDPLELKGKAEPVPAYRLLRLHDLPARAYETHFVGRRTESAQLRDAWVRVKDHRRCELLTVVGEAGVGKSRLVDEVLVALDATSVRGRCPPYGDGITYWPVIEVLKQLAVLPDDPAAADAIRSLLGETHGPTSTEVIAWAFRKTLEQAASDRPLVVVFDDLQWGEGTFLDLIEHIALLASDAPILLLCMARPEITEQRPTWPVAIRLEPLPDADVDELIPERVPGDLRGKIAHAAGGNPLFVEEMLAMAGELDGEVVVPPTLRALLDTRLDQLDAAERRVLECGAIEGEIFHRAGVQALAPEEAQVTPHLVALVRKELITLDPAQPQGEDGFRFRHLLIRDAAYEAVPKVTRAELHARFARWLRHYRTDLVELDEVVGYHLEQACRYLADLGLPEDEDVLAEARNCLRAAGRRAHVRADYGAAAGLLERVAALGPPYEIDLALEADFQDALFWGGRAEEALHRAESMAARAAVAGDRVGELCGKLQVGIAREYLEPEGAVARLAALVGEALPVFQAAKHDVGLYTAYQALGAVEFEHAKTDASLEAYEQAAAHAARAGLTQEFLDWRAACRFYGTTPISRIVAWLDEQRTRAGLDHRLRLYRALALGMLGRFDEGREMLADTRRELAERGAGIKLAVTTGIESVDFELLAGDAAAAAELGAAGCQMLDELGDHSFLSSASGTLAKALYELGRIEEADSWVDRSAKLGGSEDAFTQLLWREVKGKVLARRGDHAEAERVAREAVAIAEGTDLLNGQADTYADLAEVLVIGGRLDEAAAELKQSLDGYERKGNLVSAERVRAKIAELETATSR